MSSKEQKTPEGQAPEEIITEQHDDVEAVEPEVSAEQVDPRDEKIANLEAQLAEAQKREREVMLRAKADEDNLRRRTEQDIEKAHKFALEKFVNELLPVIDSLDRALEVADKANPQVLDHPDSGAFTWLNELVWREFYSHLLVAFPRLSRHQPFIEWTQHIHWNDSSTDFAAWKTGQTGYPIVDAAMRQLNTTGWMHNRLRMIVASFLVKDLLIDWRKGEKYFMSQLLDGSLAANNGGWQWSASTGVDASPWFRIFNPTTQGKKFDAQGAFIRHWLPEFAVEVHVHGGSVKNAQRRNQD